MVSVISEVGGGDGDGELGASGASAAATRALSMHADIAAGLSTCAAIRFHVFLSWASVYMSSKDRSSGRSMKNPPSDFLSNWTLTDIFTSLSPFSRSRCPSHLNLRFFIVFTRS